MNRATGFTLIELMVVIAVAAVLLTVGIPGIQELILNNARTSATNDLIASLQQARSESIKRNRVVTLCPSTDQTNCTGNTTWEDGWIAFIDNNGNGDRDAGEEIFMDGGASNGPTIRSDFSSISYSPSGRPETSTAADEAEFVVCDRRGLGEARMVLVFRSGRNQSSDTDLQNADPATCTP